MEFVITLIVIAGAIFGGMIAGSRGCALRKRRLRLDGLRHGGWMKFSGETQPIV